MKLTQKKKKHPWSFAISLDLKTYSLISGCKRKNTVRLQKTERKKWPLPKCQYEAGIKRRKKKKEKKRCEQASSHTLDNIYRSKRMCKNTQRRLTLKKIPRRSLLYALRNHQRRKGRKKNKTKFKERRRKLEADILRTFTVRKWTIHFVTIFFNISYLIFFKNLA